MQINVPTTNLNAFFASNPSSEAALITAIVITVIVVPTISRSDIILTFNLFKASTFPSDFSLKN